MNDSDSGRRGDMRIFKRNLPFLAIAAICSSALQCGNSSDVSTIQGDGGNTSEVSYAIRGTLHGRDGNTPAQRAVAVIRSRNFLPRNIPPVNFADVSPDSFIRSATTDGNGRFLFDSVPSGTYVIEGRDEQNDCALIDSVKVDSSSLTQDDTLDLPSQTLKPPSTIRGTVHAAGPSEKTFVFTWGMEKSDTVDADGSFSLTDLPEGSYRVQFVTISGAGASDSMVPVTTEAGTTTDISAFHTYKVTFDSRGGTAIFEQAVRYGDTVAEPDLPERAGYAFGGWFKDSAGTVPWLFSSDTVIAATTLFAKWGTLFGMALISSKGKSFQMGEAGVADTVHTVRFAYDFWMDTTEVTQSEYQTLMAAAYPEFHTPSWDSGTGPDYPAYNISWGNAVLYCNARTKAAGSLDTAYVYSSYIGTLGDTDCILEPGPGSVMNAGYRLPTEAEWEYACRAGTTTRFFWGEDTSIAGDYSWYGGNSGGRSHPVALKKPNPFGLYDMIGNALEFTADQLAPYWNATETDPVGRSADLGTARGGRWSSTAGDLHCASRFGMDHSKKIPSCGFRVCRRVK